MYTIKISDVNKNDIAEVGGKAANLGELINAGFPVPEGFCITASAYEYYVKYNCGDGTVTEAQLGKGKMPYDLLCEILTCYRRLDGGERVAVRSSATLEDLKEASFAGQQETFLNVRGETQLISAIKNCFASLWNSRAVTYRKEKKFEQQQAAQAVVVQKMVESGVAGVLFTADPLSGNKKDLLINAAYGLGEGVVSGRVSPDIFVVDGTKNCIKSKVLGRKELSVVYGSNASITYQENTVEKKNQFCLTENQILNLAEMGRQIEKLFGYPQDIEWGIKDNQIYILQSRAITTLNTGRKENLSSETFVLEMIKEMYPQLPYPLELEILCASLEEGFGCPPELSPFSLNEDGKLSVNLPELDFQPDGEVPQYEQNIVNIRTICNEICGKLAIIEEMNFEDKTVQSLVNILDELIGHIRALLKLRFTNILDPMHESIQKINELFDQIGFICNESELLCDLHYKTKDMNEELNGLGAIVNQYPVLKQNILSYRDTEFTDELFASLSEEYPAFGEAYRQIMKNYGWKSTHSHKSFSALSWHEDKTYFAALLKIVINQNNILNKEEKYDEIIHRLKKKFTGKEYEALFRYIEQFRAYHVFREESVYLLETCYGLSRKLLTAITGKIQDIFSDKNDILYLTFKEIMSLKKDMDPVLLKDQITSRKQAREWNEKYWHSLKRTEKLENSKVLKGVSGSGGKVRGTVCIIKDITEFSKLMPGQILVCQYTDPIWTPLFAIAKAVVAETGGPLSHSSIVAREYRIPAVMDCKNATLLFKDGQHIVVDGNNGEVYFSEDNYRKEIASVV